MVVVSAVQEMILDKAVFLTVVADEWVRKTPFVRLSQPLAHVR